MEDTFDEIVNSLKDLYEKEYQRLKPLVNDIISNNITNINTIETVLDELLCCYDERCMNLFLKLCNYYSGINEEYANEYMKFYKEEFVEDFNYEKGK